MTSFPHPKQYMIAVCSDCRANLAPCDSPTDRKRRKCHRCGHEGRALILRVRPVTIV